jgi:hypothetical protein
MATTGRLRRGPREQPVRVLFLDDDPRRAEAFLAENPCAVWVQTVGECLARLQEPWDEVHLDHDLGGERFVAIDRDDCGMEVVRWLCLEARPHLAKTRFYVHSHNLSAASVMTLQMCGSGYRAEFRPFGQPPGPPPEAPPRRWYDRLLGLLRMSSR